jgi:putative nucleotidyltransferase with HDIG domain
LMTDLGLLQYVLPEVSALADVDQPTDYHGDDVLTHTLNVVRNVQPNLVTRLAALFHDVGKSVSRRVEHGKVIFYGHQYAGAERAEEALQRLRYSNKTIRDVTELVKNHMVAYRSEWTDKAVRRLVRSAGEHLDELLDLYRADILARKPPHNDLSEFDNLEARIRSLDVDDIRSIRSPLSGGDVMDLLGVGSGPHVGEAIRALEKAIIDGKIPNDRDAAIEFLRNYQSSHRRDFTR